MSSKKIAVRLPVQSISEPLLVSLADAAHLLGVAIYSIRRMTRRGELPYRVIGNRWLIPTQALKNFANGVPTKKG